MTDEGTPNITPPTGGVPAYIHAELRSSTGDVVARMDMSPYMALPAWLSHPNPQSHDAWLREDPARESSDYAGAPYDAFVIYDLTESGNRFATYVARADA